MKDFFRKKVGTDGTIWNLPNYDGELFTASIVKTPFLSAIGGLNGGKQTNNFEFPTSSLYTIDAAAQPAITENQAITGATAGQAARTQVKNVTQIFQEAISVSYVKLSNQGRLSGINSVGAQNNANDELSFQQMVKLQKIARDVNYTFHNGAYAISTTADVANATRGMLELCASGNTVAAGGASISKTLMKQILRTMFAAGATFNNLVIFCNAFQLQSLSEIYMYAPTDRNVGGVQMKQLMMDIAGNVGVILDSDMPTTTVGLYEMSVIAPVFQPVPSKGNLFYEPLAKTGAAEKGQLFGQIGLDHGPAFMHGSITGLANS